MAGLTFSCSCCELPLHGVERSDGKAIDKTRVPVSIVYAEDSMSARKCLVRGIIPQVETMHCFSSDNLNSLPKKNRLIYKGTSSGSMIGPVSMNRLEDAWRVTQEERKAILGANAKILSGGADTSKVPRPVFSDKKDPVCWHSPPGNLFAEVLHSFSASCILHATETDGCCAMEALKQQIPYVGLCHTEEHAQYLWGRLIHMAWEESLNDKSKLYNPALCKLLKVEKVAPSPKKRTRLNMRAKAGAKRPKIVPGKTGGAGNEPDSSQGAKKKGAPSPNKKKRKAAAAGVARLHFSLCSIVL